jgi:dipeptidyl aminopeptidase/acylaminoacyl peptidase
VTSEVVVAEAISLSGLAVDGTDVYWSEGRPAEAGRTALVRRAADGALTELLPTDENARTAVHEYGGGAWWVRAGVVWFASWRDQRLYRRDPATARCEPLTPEPAVPRGDRFADGDVSPDGNWIVCVREHHPPHGRGAIDVRNEIVRLAAQEPSEPLVVVTGPDFVSDPRFSPDGRRLCWLEWDHPNMPWDGTRLLVNDLNGGEPGQIAGGERESVAEPRWQQDGSLTFISDRSGWWNLYRWAARSGVQPLVEIEAEIGEPQWQFGQSRYAVLGDGRIVFARMRGGFDGLMVRLADGSIEDLALPFTRARDLIAVGGSSFAVIGASLVEEAAAVRVTLGEGSEVAEAETLRPARDLSSLGVERADISVPEAIEYPSVAGRTAYALLYWPANRAWRGPDEEQPPLLVTVHGGPTGAAWPDLELDIQYLTSRGFAVANVNYGGSTGYGRAYRELLNGNWGVVDVEDCIAVARHLVDGGAVDPERICINGASAGGFTTLACLARKETPFEAGGDYFGVADLEALAIDTHKFESRYLDRLIGPYPEQRELYRERSPIHHVDDFSRPLIVLQGLEDEVVLPEQATMIVEALRARGVPVAYLPFHGEQHGFRRAPNIRRAIESELSFYAQIFGFELPADEGIDPVAIDQP